MEGTPKSTKRDKTRDKMYYKQRKLREKLKEQEEAYGMKLKGLKKELVKKSKDALLAEVIMEKASRADTTNARKKFAHTICSPSKLKAKRITTHAAKLLKVSRQALSHTNTGNRERKRRKAKDTFDVLNFLCDPENSITTAGKREKVVCRYRMDGHVVRAVKQKVVLCEKIKYLFNKYNDQAKKNKKRTVVYTFFKNVRAASQYIKTIGEAKATVCLCMKHQNFELKMRAVKKFTGLPSQPDSLVRTVSHTEFEEKIKAAEKKLPRKIFYEEWKMTAMPLQNPKVMLCHITHR